MIFLGVQVDDASADDVMSQLLVLESQDPDRDIIMYINSPGGSFTAMTAIYDTMQYVSPQIQTVVLGQAASAAAVLLAAGAPGKRLALPNARILIHQPAMGEAGHGQASDIEIQAAEILRMRTWLESTLSKHSNRTPEQVNRDIDRDKILSSEEAVDVRSHRSGADDAQAHCPPRSASSDTGCLGPPSREGRAEASVVLRRITPQVRGNTTRCRAQRLGSEHSPQGDHEEEAHGSHR